MNSASWHCFDIPDAGIAQAWAINEWIAYHLLLGVEHVNLLVENNTDNLLSVLEPWGDYVSTRTHDPELHGWQDCFTKHKDNYTWIAFFDIDEYLNPLKEGCVYEVLEDYEQYGGLSVSYGLFSDPKHRIARRHRETPMEATNFTLGQPHALVKALCVSNHTRAPSWAMPHCCSFKDGYYSVDENFEHVGATGKPCWFQVRVHGCGKAARRIIDV